MRGQQILYSYNGGAASFVGPLDGLTTGLWAALGLSRLLSSYTGPLIRIRDTTTSTESDIGSVSGGGIDTTAIAAALGAHTGVVTKWYDQSGAAHDFVQATTTKQPRIYTAGSYDGVITFDGVDDGMTGPNSGTPAIMTAFLNMSAWRAVASTEVFIEHGAGFATVGHNGMMLYKTTSGTSSTFVDVSVGTAYTENKYADPLLTAAVFALVGDRTQNLASAKAAFWSNGTLITVAAAGGSSPPAGTTSLFAADPWSIGGRNGGATLPAPLSIKKLAIYESAPSVSAVSAALA